MRSGRKNARGTVNALGSKFRTGVDTDPGIIPAGARQTCYDSTYDRIALSRRRSELCAFRTEERE
jgi:hypothetical protein